MRGGRVCTPAQDADPSFVGCKASKAEAVSKAKELKSLLKKIDEAVESGDENKLEILQDILKKKMGFDNIEDAVRFINEAEQAKSRRGGGRKGKGKSNGDKKVPESLKKMCRKHKVRLTTDSGRKRSRETLMRMCKNAAAKSKPNSPS